MTEQIPDEKFDLLKVKTEPPEEIPLDTNEEADDFNDLSATCMPILGLTLKREETENTFDDIGEYYFESDHLALKANPDYHHLLKTIATLQSQKIQAVKDIERLRECLAESRSDPVAFVNRLARKEDLKLPGPQPIVELPNIDWRKYAIGAKIPSFVKRYSSAKDPTGAAADDSTSPKRLMVRGRIVTETKPATFNQLWSSEEQQRLEDLLIEYPPEEIESKRWQKIAAALGNRTMQQVASRVQKFFIKLTKAGLPVPGRMPSITSIRKPGGRRVASTRQLLHLSSFFKHHAPPVYMPEMEDGSNCSFSSVERRSAEQADDFPGSADTMDFEDEPDERYTTAPEYRELMYLKKLRLEKLKQGVIQHFGYKCDRCGIDPISGTRWHCTVCETDSVDLCEDCMECSYEFGSHTTDHSMEPVYQVQGSKPFLDRDYMHFMGGDYNYLDPNYMPSL